MASAGGANGSVPIVAVGASAGGVSALTELVASLPAELPAAVLVVLHVSPAGRSLLPEILDRSGPLPAAHATHGEPIAAGRVYVAPPDHHLLVEDDRLVLAQTPRENGVRPSIDTLFRSVARRRGRESVAVVLSGTLDDGTAGIAAVGDAGGRTIVQDPSDAMFPGMPQSAVAYGHPNHVARLVEIGPLVVSLLRTPPEPMPAELEEVPVAIPEPEADQEAEKGPPSAYTCPDCGGTLFEKEVDGLLQFRCRVGHGYTSETLLSHQREHLESALYSAIVALEERADLSRRMGRRMEQAGHHPSSQRYFAQAEDTERQASIVREAVANLTVEPDADP